MKRPSATILKIYASHFLTGIVFWYGIEKLYMASIGIDAWGVGVVTAIYLLASFMFDIPSGIIADRWSRKGMLIVAISALGISSLIFSMSTNLIHYGIGEVFYALYFVATSGTYQALTYDTLHEENRTKEYSKIFGQAFALFFFGAAITSAVGGFIAANFSYTTTFIITLLPCALNIALLASIKEPTFHKKEQQERAATQLRQTVKVMAKVGLVRILVIALSTLTVVEMFKSEFGQLYLIHFLNSPEGIGILWALQSLTWAVGNFFAHRMQARFWWLLLLVALPYAIMSLQDSWINVVLFMLQSTAMAALANRAETAIQESTPSAVRASILSVLSSTGRLISVPTSFFIGWYITQVGIIKTVQLVAIVPLAVAVYLLTRSKNRTELRRI